MSEGQTVLPKGYNMEELLRSYFLRAGYYAVRGVPFVYERFNVTDIDIWLYSRTSSVSREITIVDSKNKRTPQAIERIFWAQGLRIATKATNAIVATTDKRPEVKNFGRDLDVVVLDGSFLQRLSKSNGNSVERITDEDFFALINKYRLSKLDGDWKGRIQFCKSLLASSLSFDSCNQWLTQGKYFVEEAITKENQRETALRCLYLICSFLALAIDYCMKELSFYESAERSKLITEGFTYGSKGSAGINKILNIAVGLVEEHAQDGHQVARQVKNSVQQQFARLNASILGEYFAKSDVSKTLFGIARDFEQLAMGKPFSDHNSANLELRSMFLCLLDFWGISRTLLS